MKKRILILHILTLTATILLVSCSDGGDTVDGPMEPPTQNETPPAKAVGTFPANGEPCSDYEEIEGDDSKIRVLFTWDAAQFAESYMLRVLENGSEVFNNSQSTVSANVELDRGKTYTWSITSANDDGETAGDTYSFTTPGIPIGNYAPYAAEITITFGPEFMSLSWTGNDEDGDDLTYDVTIFEVNEQILELNNISSSQIDPLDYIPNAEYTVQIDSKDPLGSSSESILSITAPDDQNSVKNIKITLEGEVLDGFFDETTSTFLVEYSEEADLVNLPIEIEVSEHATLDSNLGGEIDLSTGSVAFTVAAENGKEREFRVSGYTNNLLKNPQGSNQGEFWSFSGPMDASGVDEMSNGRNEFYVINYDDGVNTSIRQNIEFNRDYGGKYILFLGDLTTEKTVEGSITRHPYFWGHQNGPFNFDNNPIEEVIQGDMRHQEEANVWEVVYDANLLLEGVESVLFQMAQASGAGDPPDGTKCKFRDVEVRIFESFGDAKVYVTTLY